MGTPTAVQRWRLGAGAAVLVVVAFLQDPGRIVADTKLDLVVDPARFLLRSLQAWDPQAAFGQLQNQAYGYLLPMGSFFWAGHELGVPAWVVQRAWWALLLVTAFLGLHQLARALGIGTDVSRLLAGLAYALGPRVLSVIGPISAEAIPLVLLPWVMLPLVRASREGSVRRAAALSGLAVAAIGGINAAATLAVLVVPVLFLVTRRGPRARRLAAWWLLAVALAVAWWFLPLLVLGRYAYPFLDYIESAGVTTSVADAAAVLRGADHWLAYLPGPAGAGWQAGTAVALDPVLVAATTAVAVLGLLGLLLRRTPERAFLVITLLTGAALVGAAYSGPGGAPWAQSVQHLLDGPLAPFRNVHKFDPVLRLPITLGLAAAIPAMADAVNRGLLRLPGEEGEWLRARGPLTRASSRVLVVALLGLVLLGSALPAVTGRLAPAGSFTRVPAWWTAAAGWLAEQPDARGRTLLEPASQFGDYRWGRPQDEPLQALATTPWAVRNAVPLGAPGLTRVLDQVEGYVAEGRPSDVLAPALARLGVRYVVLRNDLDPGAASVPPGVARATLATSPGLQRVAGFGPSVPGTLGALGSAVTPARAPTAVEVFAVAPAAGRDAVTLLTRPPGAFAGGPEATVQSRAVAEGGGWRAVADGGGAPVLVTDTLTRRALNVGAPVTRAYGPVLMASQDARGRRPVADVLPYDGVDQQTTARYGPAVDVSASSSTADPFRPFFRGAGTGPGAAVDGDEDTAWISDPTDAEPTLSLALPASVTQAAAAVAMVVPAPAGVGLTPAEGLEYDIGDGPVRLPGPGPWTVPLPGADAPGRLLLRPLPTGPDRSVGVAEVRVTGRDLRRSLRVPEVADRSTEVATWSLHRTGVDRRRCVVVDGDWQCSNGLQVHGDDPATLRRDLVAARAGQVAVAAEATLRPGRDGEALLDRALGLTEVTGSSRAVDDPAARPGAAVDDDPSTAWLPAATDASPQLTVTYPRPVTVRGLGIVLRPGGRQVVALTVRAGGRTVQVPVRRSGPVELPQPVRARRLTVTLEVAEVRPSEPVTAPAVTQVTLVGAPAAPATAPVDVACGQGPQITLGARAVDTRVTTDTRTLLSGASVPVVPCGSGARIEAGAQQLAVGSTPLLRVDSAVVTRTDAPSGGRTGGAGPAEGSVRVGRWDAEQRVVSVAEGGWLTLAEGYNPGWRATTAAGSVLPALRLDGWRQAWRVPDGYRGEITLSFTPGRWQRLGLGAGLLGLLVLVLLAAWPVRSDRSTTLVGSSASIPGPVVADLVPVGYALAAAGPVGAVGWLALRLVPTRWARAAVMAAAVSLPVLTAAVAAAGVGWARGPLHVVVVWVLAGTSSLVLRDVSAGRPDGGPSAAPAAPPAPRSSTQPAATLRS